MFFITINSTKPLPGFKAAIKISSPCMYKEFHVNCMSETVRSSVLRYLMFLCGWCKVKVTSYYESVGSMSMLCTESQAREFLDELLSDFKMSTSDVFYLYEEKWYPLCIVKNSIECDQTVNFMAI